MGDDDIQVLAFAEKNSDEQIWDLSIRFEGNCLIGCISRKMSRTKNMVKAMEWVDYHTTGPEHVEHLLRRRRRIDDIMLPTNPPKFQEGTHNE